MSDLPAAVAETHAAAVFFFGDRAYKVKKPVDLGFLDFSTTEKREAACRREVDLNRRLAPDVYLGVADVRGPDGEVVDHMVVMRRMPPERRLSALLDDRGRARTELDRIAEVVADFHSVAERSPAADAAARPEALAGRWRDNTEEMRAGVAEVLDPTEIDRVDELAHTYLAGRAPLIESRLAAGRACDGHGDLLADDIFCLDDGPRILDCLEFDDQLRYEDVLADAAFLAMDLERLGHPELADHFLDAYRARSGDDWPASLAHHHRAYRAQVRAKVTAIRAVQGAPGAAEQARDLLALCRRHLDAGEIRLVVVGGLPGTGKSTLAAGLGDTLGATVLRSDVIRKELLGLAGTDSAAAPFSSGAYTAEATARTYEALLERAAHLLSMGVPVVLDASWVDAGWRDAARRVGASTSSRVIELRCDAPREVAAARMRARAAAGADPSDADEAVAARMAAVADPWPESRTVSTLGSPDAVLAGALGALE